MGIRCISHILGTNDAQEGIDMENLSNRVIKGYELLERIGSGGFGAVYKAHQSTIGREVAIKFILPGFANHPDFIRRFETEAHVIARLEHPYIVPLYDYWRDPDGAYLVMRWLRGGSLRGKLQRDGALIPDTVAIIMDNIAGALTLAHRHNVIHRDIKPGNILLDEDENAYLADFGIAKDLSNLNSSHTGADDIVGSLDYLSPEQARSEPVTARTDIYSLGVMLYEILVGKHPFHESSAVERLYKHINEPLPELTILDLNIRGAVNEVIQKATQKNPENRYHNVMEFAADFRKAINATDHIATQLTQREYDVLVRIVDGLSNKQIADEMFIAVSTVKTYINQLYRKLGVRSRVQATLRAHELDLLSSGIPQTIPVVASDSYLPEPENPYKGLRAFEAADHLDFFGREKLIEKLLDKMREESAIARFLAVIGPSGSGKSSVVKAGLIPAIWNGRLSGSDRWFTIDMLPDAHPMEELEVALTRISANPISNLDEHLWRDNRGLLRATKLILPADDTELVLIIDQFEEVFTLVEDEAERQQFLDIILTAVSDTRSRVRVVITMRADFYDRPLHYPEFGDLLRSRMETILPLSAHGLERAIVGPAEREHVIFEEGLVAHIVSEMTYQAGALPLLQYALTELFERREGRVLTHDAYQAIGGAVGALAKRAETLFNELDDEQQIAAQQMFLRLVTLGEGAGDTRRRATRSELLAISEDAHFMEEVIDLFSTYRMLSLDHDPDTRSPTVEVAHEAILGQWDRLRQWININREEIKMQQQLSRMAEEWLNAEQDPSYLASGSRLEQMQNWASSSEISLTSDERQFLEASITERNQRRQLEEARKEREAALEQRAVQRLRWLVAVFAVAAILSIGLSIFAFDRENQAQNARATSESNARQSRSLYLTTEAQSALGEGDIILALALAREAVQVDNTLETTNQFLYEIIQQSSAIRRFVGHTESITKAEFTPDGQMLLSASKDQTLILWDVSTGEMIRQFEGHSDEVIDFAVSPDSSYLVSASLDKTIILWNLASGEILRRFEGHQSGVYSVAFSQDGNTIFSGSCAKQLHQSCRTGEIAVWDTNTGTMVTSIEAHKDFVTSLAVSPDNQQLISSSSKTANIWQFSDNTLTEVRQVFEDYSRFRSVSFDADGTNQAALRNGAIIGASSNGDTKVYLEEQGLSALSTISLDFQQIVTLVDNALHLIDIETGEALWTQVLSNQEENANSGGPSNFTPTSASIPIIAFSPDGKTILSSFDETTLMLWTPTPQAIRVFTGHKDQVGRVAISPDGRFILAGGIYQVQPSPFSPKPDVDASLILWDAQTGEIVRRFEGHTDNVWDVEFSSDGQKAISASGDGTVILWDVSNGEILKRFEGHSEGIFTAAFSPDEKYIISGSWDHTLILWDIASGEQLHTFIGHDRNVMDVAFSPDGKTFLSAGGEGVDAILWDFETREIIHHFKNVHSWWVDGVAFSPDGLTAMTSSSDETMILWDIETGEPIRQYFGHSGYVLNVAFTPDGQTAMSSSTDQTVALWDVETAKIIHVFDDHSHKVRDVAINADGQWAVTASQDGTVRMRLLPGSHLQWVEDSRYIRDFTCEERAEYRIEPLCNEVETEA